MTRSGKYVPVIRNKRIATQPAAIASNWNHKHLVCADCGSLTVTGYITWCDKDQMFGDGADQVKVYCISCASARLRNYLNETGVEDTLVYKLSPVSANHIRARFPKPPSIVLEEEHDG